MVSACHCPPVATSALLTYEICKPLHDDVAAKCDYLCAIGTHGDLGTALKWSPPFPDMSETLRKYTKKAINDAVSVVNARTRTPPNAAAAMLTRGTSAAHGQVRRDLRVDSAARVQAPKGRAPEHPATGGARRDRRRGGAAHARAAQVQQGRQGGRAAHPQRGAGPPGDRHAMGQPPSFFLPFPFPPDPRQPQPPSHGSAARDVLFADPRHAARRPASCRPRRSRSCSSPTPGTCRGR